MLCCAAANDYQDVIAPLRAAAPDTMRCVLVSATLPQHVMATLQQLFPGLKPAFGPGLHRTAVGEWGVLQQQQQWAWGYRQGCVTQA